MEQERSQARSGLLRCPFCHESISPELDDWRACAGCLGRHHTSCWDESGACASCAETRALLPAEATLREPVGSPVVQRQEVFRLIDESERGLESTTFDYLWSPLTLGLAPILKAELKLQAHVARNCTNLAMGPEVLAGNDERAQRRLRYRDQAYTSAAIRSKGRSALGFILFMALSFIGVFGAFLVGNSRSGSQDHTAGLVLTIGAVASWVLTLLSLCAAHFSAVRRHEANQLYLAILEGELDEVRASALLTEHAKTWDKAAGSLFFKTLVALVVYPFFPIWLPRAFQIPLELHDDRELKTRELSDPGK